MSKIKFIETLKSFAYYGKEYKYKYIVINKSREYSLGWGSEDGIYRAKSFKTKKEVDNFLKWEVPKAELEDWKTYVLKEEL